MVRFGVGRDSDPKTFVKLYGEQKKYGDLILCDYPDEYRLLHVKRLLHVLPRLYMATSPLRRCQKRKQNSPRMKVEIPEDCWLEVLKYLKYDQWSKTRYVSRQINGIAKRNISRLPCAIIEEASLNKCRNGDLRWWLSYGKDRVIVNQAIIPRREIELWNARNAPLKILHVLHLTQRATRFLPILLSAQQNAEMRKPFFERHTHEGKFHVSEVFYGQFDGATEPFYAHAPLKILHVLHLTQRATRFLPILLSAQQNAEMRKPFFERHTHEGKFHVSEVFYGQFDGATEPFYAHFDGPNKFSWVSIEQFLGFLFHPCSYVENVDMFVVDQKILDAVNRKFAQKFANNKPSLIHCEHFVVEFEELIDAAEVSESLKWLERNVRANTISTYMFVKPEDHGAAIRLLSNFVLSALSTCGTRKMRLGSDIGPDLLIELLKKFPTLLPVEIPTIEMVVYCKYIEDAWDLCMSPFLGPNLIGQEVDSQGAAFLYVLENGHNRMRISFCEVVNDEWFSVNVKFYASQLSL
ncbi:hypothetical protein DdX_21207 [Ditylenchus destructor]|uniref:F-box domain-containing protein n=1 Tax=Ditylenchus destructor TaxID=166010 RepID=A0AAD4MHP0_9BILA|nr:hypothetical protein DdX_21207 [Ditylenchus destructor]